jgi:L-asparaginase/Glu-tRNA(Gln) amidotransferase subunit D
VRSLHRNKLTRGTCLLPSPHGQTAKPVVIVGAMRNAEAPGYEEPRTCSCVSRRGNPESRGKGVLVVLNDEINSAREVTRRRRFAFKRSKPATVSGRGRSGSVYYRPGAQALPSSSTPPTSPLAARGHHDVHQECVERPAAGPG